MFDKLAEELKQARENASLTPEQVAAKIKIDLKFLHQMEKGDFSFLPDIYLRAFIKEYARMVGLNEELIVKKYVLAKEGKPIDQPEEPEPVKIQEQVSVVQKPAYHSKTISVEEPYNPEIKRSSIFKSNPILLAMIGVAGIASVILIIYFVFFKSGAEDIVTETPIEEVIKENKQRFVEEPVVDTIGNQVLPSDSLTLFFKANDSSWLKVTFDGIDTREFYLYKNKELEIKAANTFNLIIGNAGGLNVKLNNQPIEVNQKGKKVTRAVIDKNGVKYLEQVSTSVRDSSERVR